MRRSTQHSRRLYLPLNSESETTKWLNGLKHTRAERKEKFSMNTEMSKARYEQLVCDVYVTMIGKHPESSIDTLTRESIRYANALVVALYPPEKEQQPDDVI